MFSDVGCDDVVLAHESIIANNKPLVSESAIGYLVSELHVNMRVIKKNKHKGNSVVFTELSYLGAREQRAIVAAGVAWHADAEESAFGIHECEKR